MFDYTLKYFSMFGLNSKRNMLTSPGYNLTDDIEDIVSEILAECECDNPAVFLLYNDGSMSVCIPYGNLIQETKTEEFFIDYFKFMDGEYRFCCYGMLLEIEPGEWEVIDA